MDILSFQLDPVAFAIGPLVIRWYALAYMVGFLLGWRYCLRLVNRSDFGGITKDHIDDFLSWAIVGVIVGGRLGYVLFYQLDYYMGNPVEIVKIWKGGMSFHGGVLGVAVSMAVFAYYKKITVFRLSDIICAAAPIGLFFGRIANFINGELYGMPTDLPWGVVFEYGGDMPRHPSQLYEAFLEGAVLFVILFALIRLPSVKAGTVTGSFLIGYGVIRFLVEFVRMPDAHLGYIGGVISMGQILCLPMILVGMLLLFFALKGRFASGASS